MRIIACGDIVLNGKIETLIQNGGAEEALRPVKKIFSNADLVLANIECPLTDESDPYFKVPPTLRAPVSTGSILNYLNISVGSLANNHIIDYGKRGLQDTMDVLTSRDIQWLGAGWTEESAREPLVLDIDGCKTGVLAVAQKERSAANIRGWGAGVLSVEQAARTISELHKKVDVIICYFHFGVEFSDHPTPAQVECSRKMIDCGANLVIGHHPHVPQGYEYYKDGFIAYSLGNFIFDMEEGPHRFSRMGLVVEAEINGGKIEDLKIHEFETQTGVPKLLEGDAKKSAVSYIENLNKLIRDPEKLKHQYYFICRDNLYTSLDALLKYGFMHRNIHRIVSSFKSQFWPQIFRMRIDYIKFLISGRAYKYEKSKREEKAKSVSFYLLFCYTIYIVGLGWLSNSDH
ncbi:MAG: CapA family protein [Calditrichaceae bacterium]